MTVIPSFVTRKNLGDRIMSQNHEDISPAQVEISFRAGRPSCRTLLVSPLLYIMVIPLVFLDICLELYHRLVFPILKIPLVRRGAYIKIDRHRLPFLSPVLKLACAYCGYANGLLHYAVRIAGETEAYFCPSKHLMTPGFQPPPHHRNFAEYGDLEEFSDKFHRGTVHVKKTDSQE